MIREDEAALVRVRVQVCEAGDEDRVDWQRYVFAHPSATFFHRFEWRALMAEQWRHRPHFLIARRGRDVVGVLPLAHVESSIFGSSLVSLPFCVYGGPLVDDNEVLSALDDFALSLAENARVGHLEYRNLESRHPTWSTTETYVTFRRTITDDDANMKAIPRKQRAMVRKGIANQLTASIEDADSFYPAYSDNVHRHGTPGMPRSWFRALQQTFENDCDTLVVRDTANQVQSAVLSFYFRNEVLPYYAGDYASARLLAANDFKYWQLMCHAVCRGCTVFDFGRSKVGTGPYSFKRNWGFEEVRLPYEYKLVRARSLPQNNPLNPKFRLFISAWRKLPRGVVERVGPHIVRGLG